MYKLDADIDAVPPLDKAERCLWLLGLGPCNREKVLRVSREMGHSIGELARLISACRARPLGCNRSPREEPTPPRPHAHRRWPVPPRRMI